jgi:DNA-binding MarR family transcriptional regulator
MSEILKIIWENPASSIPEIARKEGISTTAVENNLKKLRIKELIGRVETPGTEEAIRKRNTEGFSQGFNGNSLT